MAVDRRARSRRAAIPAASLVAATALLWSGGCASDEPVRGELRGTVLSEPLARPDFVLPDATGEPYAFAKRTAGKLTFLFFGYTWCPDVCPIHMAGLASALRGLGYQDRERVEVVFVTVDPERDSPERLRQWLAGFDSRFVGLRGTLEEANAVAARLNLPPAVLPPDRGTSYTVGHAASVIAFSPEGPAHVIYPFGTRREDWVHDLPVLLGLERAGQLDTAVNQRAVSVAPGSGVQVMRAFVTHSRQADAAALYAVVENRSHSEDALVSVDAPAGGTELHETVREGAGASLRMQMRPVAQLPIAARGTLRLAPGGYHVMLLRPALEWQPGDTVTVRFRFASGVVQTVQAPVVEHTEVERLLDPAGG